MQLEVELPGVKAEDLSVELEDNRYLRIQGSRRSGLSPESSFDLSFSLADDVDSDRLTVKLSAGILNVQVPKKEKAVKKLAIATDQIEPNQMGTKVADAENEVEEITITKDK